MLRRTNVHELPNSLFPNLHALATVFGEFIQLSGFRCILLLFPPCQKPEEMIQMVAVILLVHLQMLKLLIIVRQSQMIRPRSPTDAADRNSHNLPLSL